MDAAFGSEEKVCELKKTADDLEAFTQNHILRRKGKSVFPSDLCKRAISSSKGGGDQYKTFVIIFGSTG